MNYQELLDELKNPESEICELKQSFSEWDEIAKTIAAFSTKQGGKIYVGIDRKGCPIGTRCNNEIKGRLQSLANKEINPPAVISTELINHDSKSDLVIVCILVQKGNDIYSYKNVHYERRGDINYPLNAQEIFGLQKSIRRLYFDEMPGYSSDRPALVSDIDETKINSYLYEIKQISEQINLRRFLLNNDLIISGGQQVRNAAIMIFGIRPEQFIPQMKVSLSIFGDTKITDTFVKREFGGDIFDIYKNTFLELTRNIKVYSFVEGAKRIDVPEYPVGVLRECLINALVHRDYFDRNTETFIKIFTDRIEFVNPATFPFENVTFDEIKKTKLSKRRNPILSEFFESVQLMEKEGRGLSRIEEGMKEHGLPIPIFSPTANLFMVTLFNSSDKSILKNSPYTKVIDFGSLNDRQVLLINHMSRLKISMTRLEYIHLIFANNLSITPITASRDLEELVRKSILTKTGEKRGTRYFIS